MSNTPLRWARIRFAGIARGTTTGGVSAFDFVQAIQDFERHGPTRGELPDLLLRRVAEHLGVAYPVVAEAQMPPPEALFSAIRNDALARFRALLDKGADPNASETNGLETPLMAAVAVAGREPSSANCCGAARIRNWWMNAGSRL